MTVTEGHRKNKSKVCREINPSDLNATSTFNFQRKLLRAVVSGALNKGSL